MLLDRIRWALRTRLHRLRVRMSGPDAATVDRGHAYKRIRWYVYNPAYDRGRRQLIHIMGAVLMTIFVFSAVQLIGYGVDYASAKLASDELRHAYYDPDEMAVSTDVPQDTPVPEVTLAPGIAQATEAVTQEVTAVPTSAPVQRLEPVKYPNNPYRITSERFQKLKRQNNDIVGWLSIEGMIDEAVVQRDNEYYLNRDYRGYHNVNGAIFLDENCDLRTRPYTLMLYGHNMKSGLMFGGLRNYENPTYYHNNPFITFDTAYEDGRYVVFSVATISLDPANWRFVNLSWLISSSASLRSKAISSLNRFSVYKNGIDVQPEDQLLLLVTCVDEQTDRRIITARRIRDDETEESLHKQVRTIRLK